MFAPDLKAFSSTTYNIVGEGITYKVQHAPKNVLMNKKYELFLFPKIPISCVLGMRSIDLPGKKWGSSY